MTYYNTISPKRLDMEHKCMFCQSTTAPIYYHYLCKENDLGYINCSNCIPTLEYTLTAYRELNNFITPQRLVYVKIENNCMFCVNPVGPVYGRYVDIESNYGYIHCNKCPLIAEQMVNTWNKYIAYGRVKYLKNATIKIKRSSGVVESGWRINGPMVIHDFSGNEIIHCVNQDNTIYRWCSINELMNLNSA
jgi:transcription elongation factor Elf1